MTEADLPQQKLLWPVGPKHGVGKNGRALSGSPDQGVALGWDCPDFRVNENGTVPLEARTDSVDTEIRTGRRSPVATASQGEDGSFAALRTTFRQELLSHPPPAKRSMVRGERVYWKSRRR